MWIVVGNKRKTWFESTFHQYKDIVYGNLDNRLSFQIHLKKKKFSGLDELRYAETRILTERILRWWFGELKRQIARFLKDPEAFNREIQNRLPIKHRWGKVQRNVLWAQFQDEVLVRDELSPLDIQAFQQTIAECQSHPPLIDLCRDDFLRFCSIGYEAIFPTEKPCSLEERYRLHADGRDDGLLGLPPKDTAAFKRWIHNKPMGGHPWEIVRGGNTTHITLSLYHDQNEWHLGLNGSSSACVARSVKIANALNAHKIKFEINDKDHLLRMIQGEDWIGIVPIHVYPGGNSSVFEKYGERFHNEMNLGELSTSRSFLKQIHWFLPFPLIPAQQPHHRKY